LFAGPIGLAPDLPPQAKAAYTAYQVTPRSIQGWADAAAGMPASLAQAGAVTSLGDVPLIVLTAGRDQKPDWPAMQSQLLQLSTHSQQLIAEKSGHNIAIDRPEAAVAAILQMVEQVRRPAGVKQ
jgi:hypothetical protein